MITNDTIRRASAVSRALIDQQRARVIVEPYADAEGYWFGGGNMIESREGTLYVVGRYRNKGDSRTGLAEGERGVELAVFRSRDGGRDFEKLLSLSKADLATQGREVLSIEGAALITADHRAELFVSTEKTGHGYPAGLEQFQKPGTGVWSIDVMEAPNVIGLGEAEVRPLLASDDPEHLHVKDPVIHMASNGDTYLLFCTHPYSWSSSNTGYAVRRKRTREFSPPAFGLLGRGTTWDVAATRVTGTLRIPRGTAGFDQEVTLLFYDGAECLRPHEQNPNAIKRPRGHSCEEIGGLAICAADRLDEAQRISRDLPLFTSPWGTGSSRYVDVCATAEGVYATWEQSQKSGAQPLVMNYLSWEEIEAAQ